MKKNLFLILAVSFLSACVSTQQYRDFVYQKYSFKDVKSPTSDSKPISVNTNKLSSIDSIIKTERLKFYFIPAIVFWGWNNTIRCEIDLKTLGNQMGADILYYAEVLKLNEKLDGKSLEIFIESIPNTFVYSKSGVVIFFLFAATTSEQETILPVLQDLVVSYRLMEGKTEIKKGKVIIEDNIGAMRNIWKSTKKFTWLYLEEYEADIKNLSKELVIRISEKL